MRRAGCTLAGLCCYHAQHALTALFEGLVFNIKVARYDLKDKRFCCLAYCQAQKTPSREGQGISAAEGGKLAGNSPSATQPMP